MTLNDDIYLSEPQESDCERYVEIFEDGTVSKNLLQVPYPYTKEHAEWFINLTKQKKKELGRIWCFVARSKSLCDQVIASFVLPEHDVADEFGVSEIGYWLAKEHWGKGFMSLVINKVISYIHEQKAENNVTFLNITTLQATIYAHNQSSAKVLLKCGFSFDRHMPGKYEKNGVTVDGDRYVLVL